MVLAAQPESKTICLPLDAVTAPRKSPSIKEGKAKTASLLREEACSAPRSARGKTVGEGTKLESKSKTDYRHQRAEGAQQAGRHEQEQAN